MLNEPDKSHVFEPTDEEIRKIDFTNAVRARLVASALGAQSLAEYILHYEMARVVVTRGIRTYSSVEAAVFNLESSAHRAEAEKDAVAATEMKEALDKLPNDGTNLKMALKRVRDPHNIYRYRIMAEFPKGQRCQDPVLDPQGLRDTSDNPDRVLFHPLTPCVDHASDDLFKIHRREAFYADFRDYGEALNQLSQTPSGHNEYQLEKTTEGAVKQEATNYLLVGLYGGYSNEPFVIHLSPFFRKTSK